MVSFFSVSSWIRPILDVALQIKTLWEDLQRQWWFYYAHQIFRLVENAVVGRISQPVWEIGRVYNVSQNRDDMPLYIQKLDMGFVVWTLPTFLENEHFAREKMTPCFISIRYISNSGVELDIDLEREYYLSGNEILSSGFVEWWIQTRVGCRGSRYSPREGYRLVLMDTHLNTLEIGPTDVIVLNKKGYVATGLPYKKFQYRLMNIPEYKE